MNKRFIRTFVDTLSRMSTAVFLVAGLAFISVCGTLLEQNLLHDDYQSTLGDFWFHVFSTLGLFNVFSTVWFLAILTFTLLSVFVCLCRNSKRYFNMYKNKKIPSSHQLSTWESFSLSIDMMSFLEKELERSGYKKKAEKSNKVLYIRGRWNRLGYHFMHIGLLFIMVAGLLTGLLGFRDLVVLADGMATTEVYQRESDGSLTPRILPFELKSNRFMVDSYSSGMPKNFSTEVEIKRGDITSTHIVSVNKPVSVDGYRIYQSSYGDAGSIVTAYLSETGKSIHGIQEKISSKVGESVDLRNGYGFKIIAVENFSVEPIIKDGSRVDEVENRGPYMDYEIYSPVDAPVIVRSYMQHPEIIGIVGKDESVTPVFIGLAVSEKSLWSLVKAAVSENKDDAVSYFLENAKDVLRLLPERERAAIALKALQAVKVQQAFNFPFLLELDGYDKRYYSLLQVSKDPGISFFYIASILMMLGVFLMIYTRYARIVIVHNNDTLYVHVSQDNNFIHKINKEE